MRVRRRSKRIPFSPRILLSVLSIFAAFVVLVIAYKYIAPIANIGLKSDGKEMIQPIGTTTSKTDLNKKLDEKNIIVESISDSSISGVLVAVVREGPTVYFSQSKPASWQVNSLVLILSRTTVDNKKPTLIDLRHARPIVKF